MNRRESLAAMIAAGVGMIGVPSGRADEPKLRKIYRHRPSPMGGHYETVRMSELKVGDVFVYGDRPNVIEIDKRSHRVTEMPKQNEDGIWSVVAEELPRM